MSNNYYRDELKGILDKSTDESIFKIQVHGDKASSKWLNLNLESIDDLRTFLRTIELRLEAQETTHDVNESCLPRYRVINRLIPRDKEDKALTLIEVYSLLDSKDHRNSVRALKIDERHQFRHIDITRVQ